MDDLTAACTALQPTLPATARFTHLTAAVLRGWWTPPLPDDLPIFIAMDQREPRPRRRGLSVSRHRTPPPADEVEGLRIDAPGEVLLACARDLADLDLLVLVDSALHLGHVTMESLEQEAARRRRGAPRLRGVLPRSDRRAESAWEVLLRELHRSCEIEAVPQHEVTDAEGNFVARGDLWLVGTRVLHEYDGGEHRSAKRQRKDLKRDGRAALFRRRLGLTEETGQSAA